jgi:hypothetical protein
MFLPEDIDEVNMTTQHVLCYVFFRISPLASPHFFWGKLTQLFS